MAIVDIMFDFAPGLLVQKDSASRQLIETSGLDGWLEGPAWGSIINEQQLLTLLYQMQHQRKSAPTPTQGLSTGVVPTVNRSFMNVMNNPLASTAGRISPGPAPQVGIANVGLQHKHCAYVGLLGVYTMSTENS
jgi:hypothetical protein